jgi:hypothetical protein
VAANARLTASNAVVLLALLAAEGVTILRVRALLTPHVFIGIVLIPPVLLKVASTGWDSPATTAAPRPTGARGRRSCCCACSARSW